MYIISRLASSILACCTYYSESAVAVAEPALSLQLHCMPMANAALITPVYDVSMPPKWRYALMAPPSLATMRVV